MHRDAGRGQRTTVAMATVVLLLASAGLAYASLGSDESAPDLSVIRTERSLPTPSVPATVVPGTETAKPSAPSTGKASEPDRPSAGADQGPAPRDGSSSPDKLKGSGDEDDYEVVLPEVRDSDDEHKDSDGESKKGDRDGDASGSKSD